MSDDEKVVSGVHDTCCLQAAYMKTKVAAPTDTFCLLQRSTTLRHTALATRQGLTRAHLRFRAGSHRGPATQRKTTLKLCLYPHLESTHRDSPPGINLQMIVPSEVIIYSPDGPHDMDEANE